MDRGQNFIIFSPYILRLNLGSAIFGKLQRLYEMFSDSLETSAILRNVQRFSGNFSDSAIYGLISSIYFRLLVFPMGTKSPISKSLFVTCDESIRKKSRASRFVI